MKLFELQRDEDVSGSSGTGTVAQGVAFDDGKAVLHWLRPPFSTAVYDNVDDIVSIYGHQARTRLVFLD